MKRLLSLVLLSTLVLRLISVQSNSIPNYDGVPDFGFFGNSYTYFNSMPEKIFANIVADGIPEWKDIVFTRRYTPGGYKFRQHVADVENTSKCTVARDMAVTSPRPWKWFVLQEQSQLPGFWNVGWTNSNNQWEQSVNGAVGLDKYIQDTGSETMFLMTWGRRDGDSVNPSFYPDFLTMQSLLAEGYSRYADATSSSGRTTYVAPAGLVFQMIYVDLQSRGIQPENQGTLFHSLYTSDGSHPSLRGAYVVALTLYSSMFGLDPKLINWWPSEIDEETARTIQDAVSRTILDTFESGHIAYPWTVAWTDEQAPVPPVPSPVQPTPPPVSLTAPPADPSNSSWNVVFEENFDGPSPYFFSPASDLAIISTSYSTSGTSSLQLVDGNTIAISPVFEDFSGAEEFKLTFDFFPDGTVDENEGFGLQRYDGYSWKTIKQFLKGSSEAHDFDMLSVWYTATVTWPTSEITQRLRFVTILTWDDEMIYIDSTKFEISSSTVQQPTMAPISPTPAPVQPTYVPVPPASAPVQPTPTPVNQGNFSLEVIFDEDFEDASSPLAFLPSGGNVKISDAYAKSGAYSLALIDRGAIATTPSLVDLSEAYELTLRLDFIAVGTVDGNEGFDLQRYNGSSWWTVKESRRGSSDEHSFSEQSIWYSGSVTWRASDVTEKLRLVSVLTWNDEAIYIDNIKLEASF